MDELFQIEYRSTGPVPEYPEMIGYLGLFETDDVMMFGYALEQIESRPELTVISVNYNGQKVPTFYALPEE